MEYQRSGLLLPETKTPPKDKGVFEALEAAKGDYAATYEQLGVEKARLAAAEKAFLESGKTLDVDLRVEADKVSPEEIRDRIEQLKAFKAALIENETIEPEIKQAYRWMVNESIANLHMLEASQAGDMRSFRRWNEFIYGKPDEDVYRGAIDWICHDAEQLLESEDESVVNAARDVLEKFDGQRGYRELLAPLKEVFDAVRADHFREGGYYDQLLDGTDLPKDQLITPAIGDSALKHIVRHNLHSDYEVADASGVTWSVSHNEEKVKRPSNHKLPYQRYVGLGAGHEIGSHLLEKKNGQRGPLRAASVGLDRTELGNEGRAVIREQVMYDTFDEFGKLLRWRDILRRDIASGMGEGVGEEQPKSLSEVYGAINVIDTMYALSEGTPDKAHTRSWSLVARVLKGTDGTGGAYLKDKVYLEGNVAAWLTASLEGPEAISNGDLGKFDISNPRHIALLQRYGLLPDRA